MLIDRPSALSPPRDIGARGSPYEGGYFHGKLKFPPEYPLKPPSILMLTPSGRFKPNTRLCLSMSDFHPETWNPMWSVSTILMGLQVGGDDDDDDDGLIPLLMIDSSHIHQPIYSLSTYMTGLHVR